MFLPKTAGSQQVVEAVRFAATGKEHGQHIRVRDDEVLGRLTPMERRVVSSSGRALRTGKSATSSASPRRPSRTT